MTSTSYEMTWIISLLKDLRIDNLPPALLYCDNKTAFHIVANPVYHERTKHLEIDCHFIREKIVANIIKTTHLSYC